MKTEHDEALGLEQQCIRPGHWLIEGYAAYRLTTKGGGWEVWDGGRRVVRHLALLDNVRHWIREHRHERPHPHLP